MDEIRRETVRQAWERVIQDAENYPSNIKHFPKYVKKIVAEKLRKKYPLWRKSNGFPGIFSKKIIYLYDGKTELEDD